MKNMETSHFNSKLDLAMTLTVTKQTYVSLQFMTGDHGCPDRTDILVVRVGPEWSGIPDRFIFGPVRWSGIPDRTKLVREVGPEFRTGPSRSVKLVRNSGPDQVGT